MSGELTGNVVRERLCEAMLDLVCSQGYDDTTVNAVVERAGATGSEFDRLFGSKEECAIAVFDRFMEDFNRDVERAFESEPSWPDNLRAAAYAAARYQEDHPRELRFGAIGMLWASELAQTRRELAFQNFISMVDAGRALAPHPDLVPQHAAERVIGSIAKMITKRAQRGRVSPQKFVPELMYLAVLPYLGPEAAARELTMPPPRPLSDGH
jgi:AcrR family transcriptional regulator